jgi:hypothetical protein
VSENMLFSNLFIILLNVVFISTAINDSKKREQNDTEKEMKGKRIIGRFANDGEVAILLNESLFRGGSLQTDNLEDRLIVTTAQCV